MNFSIIGLMVRIGVARLRTIPKESRSCWQHGVQLQRRGALQRSACLLSFLGLMILSSAPLQAQDSLPDYQRGFSPNGTFQVNGVDNVNMFNGNLTLNIPLGPNYAIGSDFSHQLRLTYNAQIWRRRQACFVQSGVTASGMYVDGLPTFGVGWSLDLGHLSGPHPDAFAGYVSPDGSHHEFRNLSVGATTIDTSYIRVRNYSASGGPPSFLNLDFPNGQKGTYNRRIDFNPDQRARDFYARRLHLTRLMDSNENYIEVNYSQSYEVPDGQWRVANVKHFRHNATTGIDELLRTIVFHYSAVNIDNRPLGGQSQNTWTVLSSIDFPTVHGLTQRVQFSYFPGGFGRPQRDGSSFCPSGASRTSPDVAAPLLRRVQLDSTQPAYAYELDYARQLAPRLETESGVLTRLSFPTGGIVDYGWSTVTGPFIGGTDPFNPIYFGRADGVFVYSRMERPQGPAGPGHDWRYRFGPSQSATSPYEWEGSVTAPDGNSVTHTYHLEHNQSSGLHGHGLRFKTVWADVGGTIVRTTRFCYEADGGFTNVCNNGSALPPIPSNIRETRAEVTAEGTPALVKRVERSGWNGYGRFGQEDIYDWDNVTLSRRTTTQWTPNTSDWVLNLYNRQTITEPGAPIGQQTVDKWFEFNPSTGFLNGSFTHDAYRGIVLLKCRYADDFRNVRREFGARYLGFSSPPAADICSSRYPGWPTPPQDPPVIGLNGDAFGLEHQYQSGLLTSSRWVSDNTPIGWATVDFTRDPVTGLVTQSRDSAGLATIYGYDVLGRVTSITLPGEAATRISYDSPTQVTITRAGSGDSTWEQKLYDGFTRPIREIKLLPNASYAVLLRRYDNMGRNDFVSEWSSCGDPAGCAGANPSAGTTMSNFDPFGRAQTVTGADGQITELCFRDNGILSAASCQGPHSDTLTRATQSVGGQSSTTVTRNDVLGRIIAVAEPQAGGSVDVTTYRYGVIGKPSEVTQGAQRRTFAYDAFGFLRAETTPEAGTFTYDDYGSLGNLLRSTKPGSLVLNRTYDPAGRLAGITSNEGGSRLYLSNTYDDPTAGFSGGKLTQRIGFNPSISATIVDAFRYDGVGGRPSQHSTQAPGLTTSQRWFYNSLGQVASHYHPRASGAAPFVVSTSYSAGLPISLRVNGLPAVSGLTFNPSGGLSAYKTGNSTGRDVITTIEMSATSRMPRPHRISSLLEGIAGNLFDSGLYAYDGAGNIRSIGGDIFTYDARSRLVLAQLNQIPTAQGYSYDRWGNLLSKAGVSYSVDSLTNHLTAATYDARGNLTGFGGETHSYDGLGRLFSSRPTSLTYNYAFDGAGERVIRIPPSGSWTYTFRDESRRLVTENLATAFSRDNVYLGNILLASYSNCSIPNNCRVANTEVSPWQFHVVDHSGSPRLITDQAGTVLDQRRYWPFGEEAAGAVGLPQRIRYASLERDVEGSTYYDHARSHHFGIGRFLSPDMLSGAPETPLSWNRYLYASANPVSRVDRNGFADGPSDVYNPRADDRPSSTALKAEAKRQWLDSLIAEANFKIALFGREVMSGTVDAIDGIFDFRILGKRGSNKDHKPDPPAEGSVKIEFQGRKGFVAVNTQGDLTVGVGGKAMVTAKGRELVQVEGEGRAGANVPKALQAASKTIEATLMAPANEGILKPARDAEATDRAVDQNDLQPCAGESKPNCVETKDSSRF